MMQLTNPTLGIFLFLLQGSLCVAHKEKRESSLTGKSSKHADAIFENQVADETGIIHGCVGKSSGYVRFIQPDKMRCEESELEVFLINSPPDVGTPLPAPAPAPTPPAFVKSSIIHVQASEGSRLENDEGIVPLATCPKNYVAISYSIGRTGGNGELAIRDSKQAINPRRWKLSAVAVNGGNGYKGEFYAICAFDQPSV